MFETLMATIKSKVVSAEFRCATAARLQAHFNMMRAQEMQTNASAFDSESEEPAKQEEKAESLKLESREKTIGDVFASMMNQNRMAAGVRPVSSAGLRLPTSTPPQAQPAVGRNDPCPCGSGKKYKKCCGRGLV